VKKWKAKFGYFRSRFHGLNRSLPSIGTKLWIHKLNGNVEIRIVPKRVCLSSLHLDQAINYFDRLSLIGLLEHILKRYMFSIKWLLNPCTARPLGGGSAKSLIFACKATFRGTGAGLVLGGSAPPKPVILGLRYTIYCLQHIIFI